MKLSIFLLLISVLGVMANESYSQSKKLSMNLETATVKEVLTEIENQSEFYFLYSEKVIDVNRKVSVEVQNQSITPVLDALFEETDVAYVVKDRVIVLSTPDIIDEAVEAVWQQSSISGTVVDEEGLALPGVTVLVEGTTNGTVTDMDGKYTLNNVPADAVIMFSFIGFETQNIPVEGKLNIDVAMVLSSINLEEVVTVGYGTQKKINVTASISTVETEELLNIPASNLSNAIAGRAPGVQVIGNSGLAGSRSTIRIRGSFSEPLYVIDGVKQSKAAFDALDQNEVETINFLKDAASSAVYGSEAGNGVVVITTKKGSKHKPRFTYKGSYSTSRTTRPISSYTATQELHYINNMMETRGQTAPYGPEIFDYFKDKSYDINDLIWEDPTVKKHNLGVSGGSDQILYNLSLGYHDETGSYHNLDYQRYNFRSNVTAKITERFKVNFNVSGNQRDYNRWYWPYDGATDQMVSDWFRSTFNWSKLYPFYTDADGNPTNDPNDYPVKTAGGYHPPEIMFDGGYRDRTNRALDGILRFDLDLGEYVKGLSTSFQAHYKVSDSNQKSYVKHNDWYLFQPGSTENKFIPGAIDFTKKGKHNLSNKYSNIQEQVGFSNSSQINWFLNYDNTFGKHGISAVAVYEQQKFNGKSFSGRAEDLLSENIDQIYNASSDVERRHFNGGENETARASWIGRVNYSFDSKYILEFSFRYDGNYKFAPDERWGFFPSFSGAWRMTEENFMQDVDWLSNLKLRGSYGTTGSDSDISPWQWINHYKPTSGYVFNDKLLNGLTPGPMPNEFITWSTFSNWNIGFEYGFLKNKLRGELDFWGKTESERLERRLGSTPSTLGATLPKENYAQRSWNGFDFSIAYNNNAGELNYEVYANMGYAIDEWEVFDEAVSWTDGTYTDNWRSRIGKPNNRLYGLIAKGIIRTEEELNALPEDYRVFGRQPKIGTILFEDIRGQNFSDEPDGKIDNNDKTYISDNGVPRINYGWGVNLDWKGLVLNMHFQGVGAYDKLVTTKGPGRGVFQVSRPYFDLWADNYWTPETPDAKYPRIEGRPNRAEHGGEHSTFWMRNGAYMRLKNLNLAYSLPGAWYKKLGVNDIQIFANGTNLFVISDFDEHDPEQGRLDSYPIMKTYTFGLDLKF